MYTDIRVQELHIAQSTRERVRKAEAAALMRMARTGRPTRVDRFRAAVGGMLITFGESLRRQPAALEHDVMHGASIAARALKQDSILSRARN